MSAGLLVSGVKGERGKIEVLGARLMANAYTRWEETQGKMVGKCEEAGDAW